MRLAFKNDNLDILSESAMLNEANTEKDVIKLYNKAYADLKKVIQANKLTVQSTFSETEKSLTIGPNSKTKSVGRIEIEYQNDPRSKELFILEIFGIHGVRLANRLIDGKTLTLEELKNGKANQLVKVVANNFITKTNILSEALTEADDMEDIYSSSEAQKAAREAEEAEADNQESNQEADEAEDDQKDSDKQIDYLKKAVDIFIKELKALDLYDQSKVKVNYTLGNLKNTKNRKAIIDLKYPYIIKANFTTDPEKLEVYVKDVLVTNGDKVDIPEKFANIVPFFRKLNKKIRLKPAFNADMYFTAGKPKKQDQQGDNPENTPEVENAPKDGEKGAAEQASDGVETQGKFTYKSAFQEKVAKVILKELKKADREFFMPLLASGDFDKIHKLLVARDLITKVPVRAAFIKLILATHIKKVTDKHIDDLTAIEIYGTIQDKDASFKIDNNENLFVICRYLEFNDKAAFIRSSNDIFLLDFLTTDPVNIDKYRNFFHFNPSVQSTLFDNDNPTPKGNQVNAIFYCRQFFQQFKSKANNFYTYWQRFNPTQQELKIFVNTVLRTANKNAEFFRKQVGKNTDDLKKLFEATLNRQVKKATNDKDSSSSESEVNVTYTSALDYQSLLIAVKALIFTMDANSFRDNIADISKLINLFNVLIKKKSNQVVDDEDDVSSTSDKKSNVNINDVKAALKFAKDTDTVADNLGAALKTLTAKQLDPSAADTKQLAALKQLQSALIDLFGIN